jgi:Tfp pilus assembly protein PilZ
MNKTSENHSVKDRVISLVLEFSEDQQKTILTELELRLSKERRCHTRKPFMTVVDFASQGRAYREFIQNLSSGGIYIQTSCSFSAGQDVVLAFSFPGDQEYLKINGCISRVANTGIGVQFNMGSSNDKLSLRSLLKML